MPPLPSTRAPSRLPTPSRLRELCKAIALLDEILDPDWESRTFSYDAGWAPDEEVAFVRTLEGDRVFVHFSPTGTVIRGFDLEAPLAKVPQPVLRAQIFDGIPPTLARARDEEAFEDATFALWRTSTAKEWTAHPAKANGKAKDPDGSARLLWMYDDEPKTYVRHAKEYFDKKVALDDVREVYAQRIDAAILARLSPEADPAPLLATARALGFTIGNATPAEARLVRSESWRNTQTLLDEVYPPALLAQRMRSYTIVDAIAAPERRTITLAVDGEHTIATVTGDGAVLRAWLSGKVGVFYGRATRPGGTHEGDGLPMPAAIAKRWRSTAPETEGATLVAWSQGTAWALERHDPEVARLLERFRRAYTTWATQHYDRPLKGDAAIDALWSQKPLTPALVAAIDPRADWPRVAKEARAMGWPKVEA